MIRQEPEKNPVVVWQNPFPKGSREAREESLRVVGCKKLLQVPEGVGK